MKTLKQELSEAGYTINRVNHEDGTFRGMEVLKDGKRVHDTATMNVDAAWELVKSLK